MLEWFSYWPVSLRISPTEIRDTLPDSIQSELIDSPPVFRELIAVETTKLETTEWLDSKLLRGWRTRWVRERACEASRKDLAQFPYYEICPRRLELGEDAFGDIRSPECEDCLYDAVWNSSTTLSASVSSELLFGEILQYGNASAVFVVSEQMKNMFTRHEVSGLSYEPIATKGFYIAKILQDYSVRADKMLNKVNCKKHRVTRTPCLLNPENPVDQFEEDFVLVSQIKAGSKELVRVPPCWYVSRKVVELLLEEPCGLQTVTMRIQEPFKPCLQRQF